MSKLIKPWVLFEHVGGAHAKWQEIGRYESQKAAERDAEARRLTGYRIAFAYKPVAVAEDETSNGG